MTDCVTRTIRVAVGLALLSTFCVCQVVAAQQSAVVPAPQSTLSVELSDPTLSAALIAAVLAPSAENQEAIAIRYHQIGILDKALDYYSRSLSKNPAGVTALDGTARIWRDWGELGRALGSAYRAVHFSPSSSVAWNTLGTILQTVGDHASALKAYLQARRLDASASYVATNLCYLAFLDGDVERAFGECAMAVALDESSASARNNLGLVYAAMGDRGRATQTFMGSGDRAAAHYNDGIILMAEREYAAAARAFELASRTRPGFSAALSMAAFARKRARAATEGN